MSQTDIQAGRALDTRVAVEILCYARRQSYHGSQPLNEWFWVNDVNRRTAILSFSSSIADAWLVVERMRADGFRVMIDMGVGIEVMFERDGAFWVEHGDSVPLAICRAALAVVGAPNAT